MSLPHCLSEVQCLAYRRDMINTLWLFTMRRSPRRLDAKIYFLLWIGIGNWKYKLGNMKTNCIYLLILLIKYHFAAKILLIWGKSLFSHLRVHNSGHGGRTSSNWIILIASDFFVRHLFRIKGWLVCIYIPEHTLTKVKSVLTRRRKKAPSESKLKINATYPVSG